MTYRDKFILKLIRCLGPIAVPLLAQRLHGMFPSLPEKQIYEELIESLGTVASCGYIRCEKIGYLFVYDVTAMGRNWFDREYQHE